MIYCWKQQIKRQNQKEGASDAEKYQQWADNSSLLNYQVKKTGIGTMELYNVIW